MSSQTMDIYCPACHTKYNIIYYQRRAADEPPDRIVYCDNCPLDINRLSLKLSNVNTADYETNKSEENYILSVKQKKERKKKANTDFSSTLYKESNMLCIKVEGNAAQRCYKRLVEGDSTYVQVIGSPVQVTTDAKFATSYYYWNSALQGKALVTNESLTIAPFVVQKGVSVYSSSIKNQSSIEKYILAYEYTLPSLPCCRTTVLRISYNSQKPYIFAILDDNSDSKVVLSVLQSILVEFGTELSVKSIITNTTLNTLYIQSGRAYDYPFAPETGFTYTWKPDGERFWYIKYGSVWLYCRRLLSGRIAGWNICNRLQFSTYAGPILDVEVMIAHNPILIDVLATDTGATTSPSRTLDTILNDFNIMVENQIIDVPIFVRDYYRSESQLLKSEKTLGYPVDGLVGVEDGSMTIIKLKTEKSIELELKEDGSLVSSDEYQVMSSNLQLIYSSGSIIEVRFTRDKSSGELTVNSTLLRTDKLKANDIEACKNIFTTISDTPNSLAMRKAVIWCNSIRQKLNQIASKITGKGRVILDIGAGDGQSVSDYSANPEVTYILLEPNLKKCKHMMRRLEENKRGRCKLYTEAKSIITAAGLVSTGKLKYAVVCATLAQILHEQHCIRTLKSCIRCCIASFSISYTVPELQQLSINGITTIGCGYMYDSVGKNGVLVAENGVLMKYTNPNNMKDNKEAVVIWGSDKPYIETAIVLDDFKDGFYCKLAKDTVPVINDTNVSLLNTISTKVYIISTSKYL